SNTELELARAGIPRREFSPAAIVGFVFLTLVCALAVSVAIVRASSRPGAVSTEPAPSNAVGPGAPAVSGTGRVAPRPSSSETAVAPAVRVEPISTTVASVRKTEGEPANSAVNEVPHVGKKAKGFPTSGLPNKPIRQGKTGANGIVDPWK